MKVTSTYSIKGRDIHFHNDVNHVTSIMTKLQCGFVEARNIAYKESMLRALESANSFDELKGLIVCLVKNMHNNSLHP